MGLIKKESTTIDETAPATTNTPTNISVPLENGTKAAISRLQSSPTQIGDMSNTKPYKPRDFDLEARGKTRCVMFAAALQSPALAGLAFKTVEEFLSLVEQAATKGVEYSFTDK